MHYPDGARSGASRHQSRLRTAALLLALLAALLTACGKTSSADTLKPAVRITSPATSSTAAYLLQGVAFDNVGVKTATYQLGDAEAAELALAGGTDFNAELTLQPGENSITVTAIDNAGNTGNAQLIVTYLAAPTEIASNSMSGRRGTSITISGRSLGSSGSVTVGGASATITDWSENEVTFEIPATAPNGFQPIIITTPTGNGVIPDFFVGVVFPGPADLAELSALDLPAGTAVMLGVGTYTIGAGEAVQLDSLSLYGQGEAATFINTGSAASLLELTARTGFDVTISDLTLNVHALLLSSTPSTAAFPLFPTGTAGSSQVLGAPGLSALVQTAASLAPADLTTQAAQYGSLSFSDITVNVPADGTGVMSLSVNGSVPAFFAGDLAISDTRFTGPNAIAVLLTAGDMAITNSEFSLGALGLVGMLGELHVLNSDVAVSGETTMGLGGGLILSGARALSISSSHFSAVNSDVSIGSQPLGLGTMFPFNGTTVIRDSSFTLTDPAPLDFNTSDMQLSIQWSEVLIQGNTFELDGIFEMDAYASNVVLDGNAFTLGSELTGLTAIDLFNDTEGYSIDFNNNTVTFKAEGGIEVSDQYGFTLNNNTITGFNNTGTALSVEKYYADEPLVLTVTGNTFTSFGSALNFEQYYVGSGEQNLTAVITGNTFDFPVSVAPQVAYIGSGLAGTIDLSNNTWDGHVDPAIIRTFITNHSDPGVIITLD